MCKMKSGIILKDRVFVPDYDSHTDMLNELKIEDTTKNAKRLFVRAELIPVNDDVFSPIENWEFRVDQNIVPDWFVKEVEKDRMIKAVKEWAKDRIHIGVDNLKISAGSNHYIKDCKNVEVYGNATVKWVYGNATVKRVYGNATVNAAKGMSMVSCSQYGWNKKDKLILSENATFKDCQAKIIYQSGGWELRSVNNAD